jgi:hypothetical protein
MLAPMIYVAFITPFRIFFNDEATVRDDEMEGFWTFHRGAILCQIGRPGLAPHCLPSVAGRLPCRATP